MKNLLRNMSSQNKAKKNVIDCILLCLVVIPARIVGVNDKRVNDIVVSLIGCLSLSLSLALPTFFDNNNNRLIVKGAGKQKVYET